MEDWGEIKLTTIVSGSDFWCLMDELMDDHNGFIYNRTTILEEYIKGNLYGLRVDETDAMYKRGAMMDELFAIDYIDGNKSCYLLPCFCVKEKEKENNTAIMIWTHSRARRNGFAKKLVELLKIDSAYNPLPDSIGFWKKCNIKI